MKKTLVGTSSCTKSFIFWGGCPDLIYFSLWMLFVKFPMFIPAMANKQRLTRVGWKKHHVAFLVHGTFTYVSFEKGAGSSSLLAFYQLPLLLSLRSCLMVQLHSCLPSTILPTTSIVVVPSSCLTFVHRGFGLLRLSLHKEMNHE